MTGSGHWQVMLTVASPTREPDSRSVPLMLASPCHLQGAAPASSLLSPDSLRTRGLTEADSDCQSVKISVLCEPCSWLCTPRVPTASSCGMCETRHPNPEESFRMASALLVSPGAPLSVSLPGVGEGTRFVLTRVRREGRFS